MFFTPIHYDHIFDAEKRDLSVVCEATSRKEVSDYLRTHGLAKCDVFKESGEERYRGICEVTTVKSDENNLITKGE